MLKALEIALIITALHISMQDGMIFEKIAVYLRKLPFILHKPLFECLTCMGGIYTISIYPLLFGIDIDIIKTMLIVIGLNTIIAKIIHYE